MTHTILSSLAIAAMLSVTASAQALSQGLPDNPAMSYQALKFQYLKKPKKAQQPSSLSGQRPHASKDEHKGEIEVQSISSGASPSASKKRRLQAK
ncbi:hypothetical protein [Hyphomicrobium sp. CS1BSMeth3]|uniref:hypothetical protein n=1 Tax=Hyphomicrobium sp. CS1BSMeth3 TaxID=1892844 RepID=UPI00093149F0|nr:hypothetical protein [Hyphomicrobium sp. CS1BSMeth3]